MKKHLGSSILLCFYNGIDIQHDYQSLGRLWISESIRFRFRFKFGYSYVANLWYLFIQLISHRDYLPYNENFAKVTCSVKSELILTIEGPQALITNSCLSARHTNHCYIVSQANEPFNSIYKVMGWLGDLSSAWLFVF